MKEVISIQMFKGVQQGAYRLAILEIIIPKFGRSTTLSA